LLFGRGEIFIFHVRLPAFFLNGGWLPGVKGNVHLVFSWKIWKSEVFVTSEWNLGKFQKKTSAGDP